MQTIHLKRDTDDSHYVIEDIQDTGHVMRISVGITSFHDYFDVFCRSYVFFFGRIVITKIKSIQLNP